MNRLRAAITATLVVSHLLAATPTLAAPSPEPSYHLVGVSGGLQDGFAARHLLDYRSGLEDESKALLVGPALVNGYKAFLDVKQKGWREHVQDPGHPLVNPVVIPSGCAEHANIFAIYAVDSRQVLAALLSEPRFLSMTPDTGLVDLVAEETGQSVRALASHLSRVEGKIDSENAAFLLVTGVWSPGSLIESPVLYTKQDGTQVTDFPRSVALWAGTTDDARLADDEAEKAEYRDSLLQTIRRTERQQEQQQARHDVGHSAAGEAKDGAATPGGACLNGIAGSAFAALPRIECRTQARYGSSPDTVRMGKEYTAAELRTIVPEIFRADPATKSEL